VGGLVLASGYYFPTARADVALFGPPAIPVIGDAIRYTIGPPLGRLMAPGLIRRMFQPAPVTPRFKAGFPVSMMLRPWQIRASAEDTGLMIPAAAAFRHRYQELRLPVVIVAGEGDRIADPGRQSVRLHHALPQSVLTVVPGLGHMVHHGAPELVAGVIEAIALAAAERVEPARAAAE
jgi:pimeloyl-ACP methyl ester carboxylesterase